MVTFNTVKQSMKKCDICTLKCDKINMNYQVFFLSDFAFFSLTTVKSTCNLFFNKNKLLLYKSFFKCKTLHI